jgi:hypothetical protein
MHEFARMSRVIIHGAAQSEKFTALQLMTIAYLAVITGHGAFKITN